MFNPALGTFINLDPLESGSNFYAYCGDAPTDGTDPSGFAQSPPVQGHTADLTQATNPSALESNQAVLFLGHFVPTDLTDDNREEAGPIQGADEIEHVVRKMKLKTPNTPGGSHISVVGCFQPSAERLVKKLFGNEVWLTGPAYVTKDTKTFGEQDLPIAVQAYQTAKNARCNIRVYSDRQFTSLINARIQQLKDQKSKTKEEAEELQALNGLLNAANKGAR